VIGGGKSGRAAARRAERRGQRVVVLDAADGDEVVAVYSGPMIVVRTHSGMRHVRAAEVVVATGAADVHPVCPGNDLEGLLTARAAERLHKAGLDLGAAVAIGTPPVGVPCEAIAGRLVRFEGKRRVKAVVTADDDGTRRPRRATPSSSTWVELRATSWHG